MAIPLLDGLPLYRVNVLKRYRARGLAFQPAAEPVSTNIFLCGPAAGWCRKSIGL